MALAAAVHRMVDMAFTLPLRYSGDALLHAAYVLRLQEAGWYLDNDRLGAPFGLDAADLPLGGENLHWLALKALGAVAPTPWAAVNTYFLATYALVAVAAFVVLRAFRVRPVLAASAALLFAFLPYHQSRGVVHLLRSGYHIVPFLVLVVVWLAQPGRFLAPASGRTTTFGFRRDRVVAIAVVGLVAGASGTQHAAYGVLLAVLLSLAGSLSLGSVRPALLALGFAALVGASLVANNAPFVHKVLTEGTNPEVLSRPLGEQERYGLRTAHLLLPIDGHRIGALAEAKADIVAEVPAGEHGGQPLGVVLALAFVATATATAAVVVGRRASTDPGGRIQLAATCGLLALVAIAVAAPGGLALLLSALGLTASRTWNRISVFIGFGAALGGAALVDLAILRLARSRFASLAGAPVVAAVAVVVTAVGVADQTPPSSQLAQSDATRRAHRLDQAFYAAVEDHHERGAMVFQLPVTEFPDGSAVGGVDARTQLRAYLHTDHLRWSVGTLRGRSPAAWLDQLSDLTERDLLRAVAVAGFDGVVVHQEAYDDDRLAGALADLTRRRAASPARALVHHDLTGLRRAVAAGAPRGAVAAARADLLEPPVVSVPGELGDVEGADGLSWRWSSASELVYEVENGSEAARAVTFTAGFGHADPGARWIRIEGPGIDRTVGTDDDPLTWTVALPPGTSQLRVTSDGAPTTPEGEGRRLGLGQRVLTAHGDHLHRLLCAQPEDQPYCPRARPVGVGGDGEPAVAEGR